eukprot:356614-Chlamydomonas_euryale.AAC.3
MSSQLLSCGSSGRTATQHLTALSFGTDAVASKLSRTLWSRSHSHGDGHSCSHGSHSRSTPWSRTVLPPSAENFLPLLFLLPNPRLGCHAAAAPPTLSSHPYVRLHLPRVVLIATAPMPPYSSSWLASPSCPIPSTFHTSAPSAYCAHCPGADAAVQQQLACVERRRGVRLYQAAQVAVAADADARTLTGRQVSTHTDAA